MTTLYLISLGVLAVAFLVWVFPGNDTDEWRFQ